VHTRIRLGRSRGSPSNRAVSARVDTKRFVIEAPAVGQPATWTVITFEGRRRAGGDDRRALARSGCAWSAVRGLQQQRTQLRRVLGRCLHVHARRRGKVARRPSTRPKARGSGVTDRLGRAELTGGLGGRTVDLPADQNRVGSSASDVLGIGTSDRSPAPECASDGSLGGAITCAGSGTGLKLLRRREYRALW